jgi:hypothetical protein
MRWDREAQGSVRFAWKKDTLPLTPKLQEQCIAQGQLQPAEAWFHLTDVESGEPVRMHHHSIAWNAYRQRWVMITGESFGSSPLGEIWYVESDTPIGPWVYARKIVTHDRYSFYNPKQHPMFAQRQGRTLYFEGTYTHTFSGNPDQTPRYDYNQIMYRLDLDDPRLALPVPVYRMTAGDHGERYQTVSRPPEDRKPDAIAFYALDRPRPGAIAVRRKKGAGASPEWLVAEATQAPRETPSELAFFAIPSTADPQPPATVPLYAWTSPDKKHTVYRVEGSAAPAGFVRSASALCRVWRNPRSDCESSGPLER